MIDRLHYISQQSGKNGSPMPEIKAALEAGCKWIQLRVKDMPDSTVVDYAIQAAELCRLYGARLVVNDHPEIALKVGATGVHLGLLDVPVDKARKIIGKQMIVGGTANTFEQILQRAKEGVDYIGLGPFRFTSTKKSLSPILGIHGYQRLMQQMHLAGIHLPVIAVGGILSEDIPSLLESGIYGVAVSGAITHSEDAIQTVRNMYQQLNSASLNEEVYHVKNKRKNL